MTSSIRSRSSRSRAKAAASRFVSLGCFMVVDRPTLLEQVFIRAHAPGAPQQRPKAAARLSSASAPPPPSLPPGPPAHLPPAAPRARRSRLCDRAAGALDAAGQRRRGLLTCARRSGAATYIVSAFDVCTCDLYGNNESGQLICPVSRCWLDHLPQRLNRRQDQDADPLHRC